MDFESYVQYGKQNLVIFEKECNITIPSHWCHDQFIISEQKKKRIYMIYGHLKHSLKLPSIPAAPEASQQSSSHRGSPAEWQPQRLSSSTATIQGPSPAQPAIQGPSPAQPATQGPAPRQPAIQGPSPVQPATQGPAPRQPAIQGPSPVQPATQGPAPRQPAIQGPSPAQPAKDQPALHPKHPGVASCTA